AEAVRRPVSPRSPWGRRRVRPPSSRPAATPPGAPALSVTTGRFEYRPVCPRHRAPTGRTDDCRSDSRGSCRAARPQGPRAPRCVPEGTRGGPDLHRGPRSRPGHPAGRGRRRPDEDRALRHRGRGSRGRRPGRARQSHRDARRAHRPGLSEARRGAGGRGVRPQAGRADHRALRRRDRHHHPEPRMTRPSTTGHTDPTVQPVPASVVERVDAADTTLQNPRPAVVSLGANLGNRLETLQGAVDALEDTPGIRVKAVSPVYETEPWGVEPGSQPSYFNAVAVLKTTLPPSSLLERAQAVEEAFHRVRDERWGPRTLDVDIVSYAEVRS